MFAFETGIERPIIEPGGAALAAREALQLAGELAELPRLEAQERLSQQGLLAGRGRREVDRRAFRDLPGTEHLGIQQAVLHQRLGRDQERVSGKGGERVVGRVPHAGRTERQNLPDGEAGAHHPVEHRQRRRTEVADREAPREARRMQEQAGGARPVRGGSGLSPSVHSCSR